MRSRSRAFAGIVGDGESFAAGKFQDFAVAERVGDLKAERTGLAGAEKFAGAAQMQVGFGDLESVARAHHGFQTGAGLVGHAHRADEDAVGFCCAAADAPTKLMQLRKAEALGVFDDHYRRVGNVDADFHDGSGDENLHFVFAETLHYIVFFFAGQAAVQQAQP